MPRIKVVARNESGSMFVFRGVRNRSFARSVQGWIYSVPENKCDPRIDDDPLAFK
jgi:hypothetical protein